MLQLPPMVVVRLDEAAGGPEKRSCFVRLLLERRLAARPTGEQGRASIQVNIRIGAKELGRLQCAATAAGMTRTEWIVALIRRHHFATPQFPRADRIALMEVHRELHRIGALLRGFASDKTTDRALSRVGDANAQIFAAIAEIEDQLRGLRCGIRGNFEYWSIDP